MDATLTLEPPREDRDMIEVAATLHSQGAPLRLWWRLPVEWKSAVTEAADPFVIGFLFPLMQQGQNLQVEGTVSPSLLENLEQFMALWHAWHPERYRPIHIRASRLHEPFHEGDTATMIMPFSTGVDASFTAYTHVKGLAGRRTQHIGAAIVLNNFDIFAGEDPSGRAFTGKLTNARLMLDSLEIPCIPLDSNFRQLPLAWVDAFGAHLASALTLFSQGFHGALIPNNLPYAIPFMPWGSNPYSDRYLGSQHFRLIDDGGAFSRPRKVDQLREWPEFLQHLQVCYSNPASNKNCCRCEKCIRTILAFRIAGIPQPPCFATDVTDRQIRRTRLRSRIALENWRESLINHGISAVDENASWMRAIRTAYQRGKRRTLFREFKSHFIPLRNRLKKAIRRH